MKKIFIIICLSIFAQFQVNAVLHEYISDSECVFYYFSRPQTEEEIEFANSQIIDVSVATKDPNFSQEVLLKEAKKQFRDLIYPLYLKNQDYMWRNFPQYRYTFEEVYEMIYKLSYVTTYYGFDDNTCEVYIKLDIPLIVSIENGRKEIAKYPYVLGYIYKGSQATRY